MSFEIQVKAPARMELEVELGVGRIDILGFKNDITVDQGIGELHVTMAESRVSSVDIDAGLGEANLRYTGGRMAASGIFDNDLRWNEGNGAARVSTSASAKSSYNSDKDSPQQGARIRVSAL